MLEIIVSCSPPSILTSVHVVGQLLSWKQHGQGEEECLSDVSSEEKERVQLASRGLKRLNFPPCQALWLPWEVLHQPLNTQGPFTAPSPHPWDGIWGNQVCSLNAAWL